MNISDIDDVLDFAIFLLMLIIAFMTAITYISMIKSDVTTLTLDDKTALHANNDNTPIEMEYDVPDMLLSLVVADEYQPDPNKLVINNGEPVIFDQNYTKDSVTSITKVWNNQLKNILNQKVKEFQVKWDANGTPYWSITTGR